MKWNEVEKSWAKLITAKPDFRAVTEKINWIEVRLHNAPYALNGLGHVPELPEEIFVFWPEDEIETRRTLLARKGPYGMNAYSFWGSPDQWVGLPLTAEMLAQSEATSRSLLAAWVSAVLHDSKGEKEVKHQLGWDVMRSLPEGYTPWSHNTKHTLREIVPFDEEFNEEWGSTPIRTLADLLSWVARNALHNQSACQPVRISSTYDDSFRPLSLQEQMQAAAERLR